MAFGALVDTSFVNDVGETCRILLERDGYSSTTYAPSVQNDGGYVLTRGETGGGIDRVRANVLAKTEFVVTDTTLLQELRKIPRQSPRNHRLTLERGGTTRFKGWCKPSATSTPRNDKRTGRVTVQAKDQIKGLSADWTDSSGSRFTGNKTYSVALTDILSRLNLSLPVHVVMDLRPSSMTGSDDPFSIQAPTDAFYRKGSDDKVRAMKSGAVLDDLLATFNCQIVQREGVWTVQRPGAFTSGHTDSNDEVTLWKYDSTGTFQSSVNEAAAVDVTSEAWRTGSGEVGGEPTLVDSRVTYEHGSPKEVDLEGSFETTTNWTFDNSTHAGTLGTTTENAYIYEGSQGLKIEGQQYDPNNLNKRDNSDDFARHTLGILTPAAEPMTLILRDRARTGKGTVTVDDSHQFWSLRLEVTGSTTVYWWDESNNTWTTSPSPDRRNEIDSANPIPMDSWRETKYQIPAPPDSGEAFLKLWNPTYDEGGTTINSFYGAFDALVFERTAEGPSKTVYRVHDPTVEEGETLNRTVRLGQGPWKGSKGALLDNSGNLAFDWSVVGSSSTYILSVLAARDLFALRQRPQETTRFRLERPSAEPRMDRALDYDGRRYWPVMIKETQPDDTYDVRAIEIIG